MHLRRHFPSVRGLFTHTRKSDDTTKISNGLIGIAEGKEEEGGEEWDVSVDTSHG